MTAKFYMFIFRNVWIFAFILICGILFENGMRNKKKQFQQMQDQLKALDNEKKLVTLEQQNLLNQINSQSDPAWIELVLIKGLGVSPEESQKFYFVQHE